MNITHYLEQEKQSVENALNTLIPKECEDSDKLYEAARYALLGGGKRLRPILALAVTEACGGNKNEALYPACVLELIHAYSLIHDDLPCMDDDDFRRGKPSLHKKYNEGHAVLTGDFLLTYSFEILANAPHLSPSCKIQLIDTLAKKSGGDGMIGGQVLDMASEGQNLSFEALKTLQDRKTGALITAAVQFGGIIANVSPMEMEELTQFGESLGLAFQIIDDILDITHSETKHGNKTSSDVRNHKTTAVSILGLEKAHLCAEASMQQALNALAKLKYDTRLLRNLATHIGSRTM